MPEDKNPITVPEQPNQATPLKKGMPIVIALSGILVLFVIVNLIGLITGKNKAAPASSLPMRPTTVNPQQVAGFQTQQDVEARRDAEDRARRQMAAQFADESAVPGPEVATATPMTEAQSREIYGNSPNAPTQTSAASEAQAEAKQRALAREKQKQDALNSDTVAIDFARKYQAEAPSPTPQSSVAEPAKLETRPAVMPPPNPAEAVTAAINALSNQNNAAQPHSAETTSTQAGGVKPVKDPLASYPFDDYTGQLYRVFEGTVLEGVVTNHIDGGLSGPILVMLTTDYYSHDHQQLLLPQGTRLIGTVGAVNGDQQRKLMVTFHRAVCPDGFSIDLDNAPGLDQIGTTGIATNVNHGYLTMFTAAAAVGGLGGLAQIGNSGSILDSSTQIRNGISSETAQEGEQILNHFLNRLPIITLKEGSRARIYMGRDFLIPSYAEHRVNPTL